MIRLFIALPLPAPVRTRLGFLAGGLAGANWVPPDNLHLTLRFVGEIDEGRADDLADALDRIQAPGFAITLAGAGSFDRRDRPYALWLGVEPCPGLHHLHSKIERACQRAGLAPDSRRFHPHVTLARLKDCPPARLAGYLAQQGGLRIGPVAIDRFMLFSSWLQNPHPIYRAEMEIPLGSDGPGQGSDEGALSGAGAADAARADAENWTDDPAGDWPAD